MIFGQRFGDPVGRTRPEAIYVRPESGVGQPTLLWDPERGKFGQPFTVPFGRPRVRYQLYVDEVMRTVTDQNGTGAPTDAREHIEVFEVSDQNDGEDLTDIALTPNDVVVISWDSVSGADEYRVYRSETSGNYDNPIAVLQAGRASYSIHDGPHEDKTLYYKVVAVDDAGNTVDSAENSITISSAPEPPSDVSYSVSSGTLELTWTASDSSDVDHYAVYRGSTDIELTAAPHATPASSPWSEDVSGLTGTYAYLVRAVDSDGNEEANLTQIVLVDLDSGSETSRPNQPSVQAVEPAADGEARVRGAYRRDGEDGSADVIELYANNGQGGAIDYGTAVGSYNLGTQTLEQYDITSSGLVGGRTYRVAVRAVTSGGTDDGNTDAYEVETDAEAPGTPSVTLETT